MSKIHQTKPVDDGFYMPGEHQKHSEIWIGWPERPDCWRLGAKPAQAAFVELASAIAEVTPVTMTVSAAQYDNARSRLPSHIRVVEMTNNDSWMRDQAPTFVINNKGERRGIDWNFNAWGGLYNGLYFPWDRDEQVAQKICEMQRDDSYQPEIVLEGGSIHTDGDGTLYTNNCLLSPGRNPDLSKEQIEQVLKDHLGVEKIIWLGRGVYNDESGGHVESPSESGGHIDNMIHVVKPGEVVLNWTDDENDPQHAISTEVYEMLSEATDAKGRKIKIHKLHMPGPLHITAEEASGIDGSDSMEREIGERLAGSYANFLITNGRILLPLLDATWDVKAKAVLEEAYPDHEVVGVKAREILLGGGNIHCITQQVPAI